MKRSGLLGHSKGMNTRGWNLDLDSKAKGN
jgi:hypothetical protein